MVPNEETLKKLPESPGVYTYRDGTGTIIYIGKAKNLKRRVRQYFTRDDAVGEKTSALVAEIADISWRETLTEFDAIVLEAAQIRLNQPKYNVISRDDKSPIYLVITREELPRIHFARKTALPQYPKARIFGPFQSAFFLRMLMKRIRTAIPFCLAKERTGKACFYTHLGLCDPCPSVITALPDGPLKTDAVTRYRANIRRLVSVLSGQGTKLVDALTREMERAAEAERFEEAARLRDMVSNLNTSIRQTYDPTVYMAGDFVKNRIAETQLSDFMNVLSQFYPGITKLDRIECYDISHTGGTYTVGSMVVFTGGVADTSQYRRFRVKLEHTPNDAASIAEVLSRRLTHDEWPVPDLIVVDGGKPQLSAAVPAVGASGKNVPLISIAKREEEIIIPKGDGTYAVLSLSRRHAALQLIQRLRDESHRFGIKYHRLLRSKAFTPDDA